MRKLSVKFWLTCLTIAFSLPCFSQVETKTTILKQAAVIQAEKERVLYEQLKSIANQKGWDMVKKDSKGNIAILVGVDGFGLPLYLITESNVAAAATIGTNTLWPGGSSGLNLNGSSANVKDKLAVWDGGRVRLTHAELTGRVVQRDAPASISDHATHVSGTMIASGVNPLAKGMSYGLQELVAYDFSNHLSEMLTESPNLLVSNHSYGSLAGWVFNEGQNRWEFWGQDGTTEDYKFGYYSTEARDFDSIAYNAPFYLIVKSSGNKRNENGPAVGSPYWRFNASGVMADAGARPPGISDNSAFDIIPTYGTAKNILTVGAVNALPNGYTKADEVVMSGFSSWGPTDDGRIKPDVVSNGVGLLSSIGTSDNSYATYSGTSMAAPSTSGSLLLLQQYYSQLHTGTFMRSASLKGLVIHTADEAGIYPGPDYSYGWGLINMKKAAAVITANNSTHLIHENVLNNAATYTLPVIASGDGKISATICWTDPKGDVEPVATALNNTTKRLVNDLDIVIKRGTTTYRPWVLNPLVPANGATTGDNTIDNVEKIELPDVVPGETYTIEVKHKGTLARGQQAFSLIASGVGGTTYCTSNATSTAGARIDSVSFANIQNKNAAGCTSYNNFTGLTANLQPGQTLPFFVRVNSCDASSADKIIKVYIDANNDGDFTDANENVATSGVISGTGDFTGNITVPAGLSVGKYTIVRVVMQETSSAAAVAPCGSYTRGETQDYRVLISLPVNDVGISALVAPSTVECGSTDQYVAIRIRNHGSGNIKNIPLTTVVKQGTTTIATLTATYTDTVYAQTDEVYTFQTPVTLLAGTAYTFTSSTGLAGDQDASNNQNETTITTRAASSNPGGTAIICGTNALLNATPVTTDLYNWYNSATATTPIASGANTATSTIAATYYVSKNEINTKLGPATKMVHPQGSYNVFNDNLLRWVFTTNGPAKIENARLYTGHAGKITFTLRKVTNINYLTGTYSYFPSYDKAHVVDVYPTAPSPPTIGAQINDPNDAGAIFHLGFEVPEAGEWGITMQSTHASVYRNNQIVAPHYPYSIPGVITLTGNSASNNTDPNYYQGFYYIFYNANVEINACPSARVAIVPTTATTPVISVVGNVLTSTAAPSYQWYRNSVPIPGATSQSYTATESGLYKVETTTGSCSLQSAEVNFTATPVTNVDPNEIGMVVSPNPTTTGQLNLQLETRTKSDLHIALLNTVGQKVYGQTIPAFTGRLSRTITPGKLPAGIYYLQVQHDKKMYVRKVVVSE